MLDRTIWLAFILLLYPCVLLAQKHGEDSTRQDSIARLLVTVKGKVVDADDGETLPGAYIYVGKNRQAVATTDTSGVFVLKNVVAGEFELSVSFVGYETFSGLFDIREDKDVGEIRLRSVILDEVVVSEQVPLTVRHGDTTKFSASAVKVAADADLEDLIKRLPGFEIVDGKIRANGKEVTQIYIDGQEYSFNNPGAVLKNLPAKLVNKIALYEGRSRLSDFSGVDDGQRIPSINIETHDPEQAKVFGVGEVGYGLAFPVKETFEKNNYDLSVRGNFFTPEHKLTLTASMERRGIDGQLPDARYRVDNEGSRQNTIFANISSRLNEKFSMSGNYSLSGGKSYFASLSVQDYFPTEHYEERIYENENHSWSDRDNHSLNMNMEYQVTEKDEIRFSPMFSIGKSCSNSLRGGSNVENGDTVNVSDVKNATKDRNMSVAGSFDWLHGFEKEGRTLSISVNAGYNSNSSENLQNNIERSTDSDGSRSDTVRNLLVNNDRDGKNFRGSVMWGEPLTENARLAVSYEYSLNSSIVDKHSLAYRDKDFKNVMGIDSSQTNKLENILRSHACRLNYDYSKERFHLGIGGQVTRTQMRNSYTYLGEKDSLVISRYTDLSPMLNASWETEKEGRWSMSYSGYSSSPDASQLQDVLDVSDPLQVSRGNPALKKSYSHDLSLDYSQAWPENSSFLFATLRGGQAFNEIASNVRIMKNDTVINGYALARGAQLTSPVNLNGGWDLSTNISYSFLWEQLKLRINTSVGYSFRRSPSIYDNVKNMNNSHTSSLGFTLSSDFSEDLTCFVSSSSGYVHSKNTESGQADSFNESLEGSVNWMFWHGFFADVMYNGSFYITKKGEAVRQTEHLLNVEIGKKFGKERRLKLALSCEDVLQNRRTMNYSLNDLYASTSYNLLPSSYLLFSLSYRFDNIGRPGKN